MDDPCRFRVEPFSIRGDHPPERVRVRDRRFPPSLIGTATAAGNPAAATNGNVTEAGGAGLTVAGNVSQAATAGSPSAPSTWTGMRMTLIPDATGP